jgi:hypothetical protein
MNSPDKIFFNLACVGAAMLAVGELKAICGSASPRGYICYLSLSILSLFAYAVPYAVEALGGVEGVRSSTLGESAVLFGLLIYACARALALINDKKIAKED